MMMKDLIQKYNEYENELIKKFNEHKFYTKFSKFNKEEFSSYLLQLGHLSLEFVKFIERAKLPLKTEIGKEVVRDILRDEIPNKGPTHQDSRFTDLRKAGFDENQILNTLATKETKNTIKEYYELINYPQEDYDLKVMITLRVLGEVLVGETYRHVVNGLKKHFGIDPKESLFYTLHWKHDRKGGRGDKGRIGHTEYYDKVLVELIKNKEDLEKAKRSALKSFNVRCKFHEQFINY